MYEKQGHVLVFNLVSFVDSVATWCNQPSQRGSFSLQFAELRLQLSVVTVVDADTLQTTTPQHPGGPPVAT